MKTLFGTEFDVTVLKIGAPGINSASQHTIKFKENEDKIEYWKRCCHLFIEGLGESLVLKIDIINLIYLWFCMFKSKNIENFDELSVLYNQVISSEEYIKLKNTKFNRVEHMFYPELMGDMNGVVNILKNNKGD